MRRARLRRRPGFLEEHHLALGPARRRRFGPAQHEGWLRVDLHPNDHVTAVRVVTRRSDFGAWQGTQGDTAESNGSRQLHLDPEGEELGLHASRQLVGQLTDPIATAATFRTR